VCLLACVLLNLQQHGRVHSNGDGRLVGVCKRIQGWLQAWWLASRTVRRLGQEGMYEYRTSGGPGAGPEGDGCSGLGGTAAQAGGRMGPDFA